MTDERALYLRRVRVAIEDFLIAERVRVGADGLIRPNKDRCDAATELGALVVAALGGEP